MTTQRIAGEEKWLLGLEPDNRKEYREREEWVLSKGDNPARLKRHRVLVRPDTWFQMADINDKEIALTEKVVGNPDMQELVVAWFRRDLWEQMGCPTQMVVDIYPAEPV